LIFLQICGIFRKVTFGKVRWLTIIISKLIEELEVTEGGKALEEKRFVGSLRKKIEGNSKIEGKKILFGKRFSSTKRTLLY
jgi:hypothetical protein